MVSKKKTFETFSAKWAPLKLSLSALTKPLVNTKVTHLCNSAIIKTHKKPMTNSSPTKSTIVLCTSTGMLVGEIKPDPTLTTVEVTDILLIPEVIDLDGILDRILVRDRLLALRVDLLEDQDAILDHHEEGILVLLENIHDHLAGIREAQDEDRDRPQDILGLLEKTLDLVLLGGIRDLHEKVRATLDLIVGTLVTHLKALESPRLLPPKNLLNLKLITLNLKLPVLMPQWRMLKQCTVFRNNK